MDIIDAVFLTIGFLVLAEGLIISLFPKLVKKVGQDVLKNPKKLRKMGIIEIILAIIFIVLGLSL